MSRHRPGGWRDCGRDGAARRRRIRAQAPPLPRPHRRRLGEGGVDQALEEELAHERLKVVSGIGAVERFVAEREVGDDVALDRGFEQRPLEP